MSALAKTHSIDSSPSPRIMTRVLLATDNPASAGKIASELRRLDLDVQLCLFDGSKLSETPKSAPDAVLCHLTDYVERGPVIARALRDHFAPRDMPIIGAMERPAPDISEHFDTTLFAPMHPAQIANRVNAMIRLGAMEQEIQRRMVTLREDFGANVALSEMKPDRKFRVLFIGKATPAFMVIVNALQDKGVNVVAAFTSFSAFDYLHGEPFDAVVMNALEQSEPALTISETMRRNAKLYHVPTLFLVNPHSFTDHDAAYAKGARDIIEISADTDEISGRVLELANYHRIHEQLKSEIMTMVGETGLDKSDTVFSRRFMAAHMPRLVEAARQTHKPLTVIALRTIPHSVEPVKEAFVASAIVQTGAMIRNLVRMQDSIARMEGDVFLLAFSNTSAVTAERILDRIRGLVDVSAYDSGVPNAALTISVDSAIVEWDSKMSGDKLMATALIELKEAAV